MVETIKKFQNASLRGILKDAETMVIHSNKDVEAIRAPKRLL